MGFGEHMHDVFAAGRMRLAKPDLAYFKHIEDALGYTGNDVILIDDMGWKEQEIDFGSFPLANLAI